MIKGGDRDKSKYSFLIREIISSMEESDSCITHIRRNINSASHFMAHSGRLQCRTDVQLCYGPKEVLDIVGRDCNPYFSSNASIISKKNGLYKCKRVYV